MGAYDSYNALQRYLENKPKDEPEPDPWVVKAWLMWAVLALGWTAIIGTALWGMGV